MQTHTDANLTRQRKPDPTRPWKPDLKIALLLAILAGLATAALVPYLMQMMPERFALIPVPLWVLVIAQALQACVLLGVLSLLGLRMGHRTGLGAPLLQHWLNRQPLDKSALKPLGSALIGALAAMLVIGLSLAIDPLLPPMQHPPVDVGSGQSAFNGLLASFYGGIAEELQLRLFLMTLLVWIVARIKRARPRDAIYWNAIIAAALLFGVGHLPAAGHVWGLDAMVVTRTVLLNAVAGVAFGWLYWKRGLEMAIVGHFAADIVLHVLGPLLSTGASP